MQKGKGIVDTWEDGALQLFADTEDFTLPTPLKAARERVALRRLALRTQSLQQAGKITLTTVRALERPQEYQEFVRSMLSFRVGVRSPRATSHDTVGLETPQMHAAALQLAAWNYARERAQHRRCPRCAPGGCCCGGWVVHAGWYFAGTVASKLLPGPAVMLLDAHNGCVELQISHGSGEPFTESEVRQCRGHVACSKLRSKPDVHCSVHAQGCANKTCMLQGPAVTTAGSVRCCALPHRRGCLGLLFLHGNAAVCA